MTQVYEAIFEIFDRCVPVHQQQFKGPFTWEEDDPSARIILEGSFGLHAKTWLLGSTFHLDYMQDLCSTRLQSKMAASNDKSEVDNCLSASICHYICNSVFQTQQQRATTLQLNHIATISSFQIAV